MEVSISMLRNEKSPWANGLHPEIIKRKGGRLVEVLYIIVWDTWENLKVPADWKDAQLATIVKTVNIRDNGIFF